jgi:hypothetical protein
MTDRVNSFLVVLKEDIREDDADGVINAIRHINGVIRVVPQPSDSFTEVIASERLKLDLHEKIMEALWGKVKGD